MKFVDEFRDPDLARRLVEQIRERCSRSWRIMDVCGGQTHNLLRYGIEAAIEPTVRLIHGPGCPVCVTPAEAIDFAQQLAHRRDTILTTFGDMMRVPGSHESLLQTRAGGGTVRSVYSPLDAVQIAAGSPDQEVVFLAVGFETTMPATALAIQQAQQLGLLNFSVIVAHVSVLPAMHALVNHPDHGIDGFLAAGHVCTVTGFREYDRLASMAGTPIAVTGFEPIDLLFGLRTIVDLLESDRIEVVNCYARSVHPSGNLHAMRTIDAVYEPVSRPWRGMGVIAGGGWRLHERYRRFCAEERFGHLRQVNLANSAGDRANDERCRSGEVLAGLIKPPECPHFGTECHPDDPLGAPMVSSEGACAAYFRYRSQAPSPPAR